MQKSYLETAARVADNYRRRQPLQIVGDNSKHFYGEKRDDEPPPQILSTKHLIGAVDYWPSELILTAPAGTPLSEIESLLSARRQMLPFDPPRFLGRGTLGGAIAAGLSGGGRARYGAARDFVLGITLINGLGECLKFGGRVMKNVAGYDVSRLNVGALGTLGVMAEITVKVLPQAAAEASRVLQMPQKTALARIHHWQKKGMPLSATFYDGDKLFVRLSSAADDLSWAIKEIGGDEMRDKNFWRTVRDHSHPFFCAVNYLWRLPLPLHREPPPLLLNHAAFEWNGMLYWLREESLREKTVRELAEKLGGHACLFKNSSGDHAPVFHPLSAAQMNLHRRVKNAFDPAAILNRGRLYKEI